MIKHYNDNIEISTTSVFYNPICYSLYTDDVYDKECLKRCFHANDLITGYSIKVFVCAEYYRLVYHKYINEGETHYMALRKTITETTSDYIPLMDSYDPYGRIFYAGRGSRSFENIKVDLTLIDRPLINITLPIHEALQIVLDHQNQCHEIKKEIANSVYSWSIKNDPLKKDLKMYEMIKKAFNVSYKSKKTNQFYNRDFYTGINEIELLNLITNIYTKIN